MLIKETKVYFGQIAKILNENFQTFCGVASALFQKFCVALLLVTFIFPSALAQKLDPQPPKITSVQKKEIASFLINTIESLGSAELRSAGIKGESSAQVNLSWNELKLQQDFSNYLSQAKKIRDLNAGSVESDKNFQQMRKFIDEVNLKREKQEEEANRKFEELQKAATAKEEIIVPKGTRFGWLNLDLKEGSKVSVLPRPSELQRPPSGSPFLLSLALPNGQSSAQILEPIANFVYDAADYITAVQVKLTVPAGTPKDLDQAFKQAVMDGLKLVLPKSVSDAVNFSTRESKPLAEPAATPTVAPSMKQAAQNFAVQLLEPKSPFLSSLALAIPVSLALLICCVVMLLMWRNSNQILSKIFTQKQEAENKAGAEGKSDQDGGGGESNAHHADTVVAPEKDRFDSTQMASALTQQFEGIRSAVVQIAKNDPEALAECVSNLCLVDGGYRQIAEVCSFVGFDTLNPVLQNLGSAVRMKLENLLLERRHRPPSLLEGAESAQLVSVQGNSRISELREIFCTPEARTFRRALLKIDDSGLLPWLEKNQDDVSAALALTLLTPDRGLLIIKGLSPQVSSKILKKTDEDLKLTTEIFVNSANLIKSSSESAVGGVSHRKKMLKLLSQNIRRTDEERILSLLDGPDWELRFDLMKFSYLFNDLVHLPGATLRQLVEGFKGTERSQLTYLLPLDVRNIVLGAMPEGSKVKEMLLVDLEMIENSEKKKSEANQKGQGTLDQFVANIRSAIVADPELLRKAIESMCAKNNWPLPPQLNADGKLAPKVADISKAA